MPIIAKHQPLHSPSMQNPPTIAVILFDVIADKVHTYLLLLWPEWGIDIFHE